MSVAKAKTNAALIEAPPLLGTTAASGSSATTGVGEATPPTAVGVAVDAGALVGADVGDGSGGRRRR